MPHHVILKKRGTSSKWQNVLFCQGFSLEGIKDIPFHFYGLDKLAGFNISVAFYWASK
jgi:hypothetical protein